jgi:hypothetical protein
MLIRAEYAFMFVWCYYGETKLHAPIVCEITIIDIEKVSNGVRACTVRQKCFVGYLRNWCAPWTKLCPPAARRIRPGHALPHQSAGYPSEYEYGWKSCVQWRKRNIGVGVVESWSSSMPKASTLAARCDQFSS